MSGNLQEVVHDANLGKAGVKVKRLNCGLSYATCNGFKNGYCIQPGNGGGDEKVNLPPGSKSRDIILDRLVHCGDPDQPESIPMDLKEFFEVTEINPTGYIA